MSAARLRVGIVGLNAQRGWAATAHVPALRSLPGYEITALCTTRRESAAAAAQAFGIAEAHDGWRALVASPNVDLVSVTVKAPEHREPVLAALAAGKQVYCEWPLGRNLAEAEEMAAAARRSGLRCAVGLQARSAPLIRHVRELVHSGAIGEVLSTSLVATGLGWGAYTDAPNRYLIDRRNGATLLSIPAGHALDALCGCLGEFRWVGAAMALRRPQVILAGTGESLAMTAPDQLAVHGELENGALVSLSYRGGAQGTGLLWEILGSSGGLRVTGEHGHLQFATLSLQRWGEDGVPHDEAIPASCRWVPSETPDGPALNVAQAYAGFALAQNDIPDFDAALQRHRLLDAIERAAASGQRVTL